jgi:hypothetical protein
MTASDSSYPAPADSGTYEAGLTTVGDFDKVEFVLPVLQLA